MCFNRGTSNDGKMAAFRESYALLQRRVDTGLVNISTNQIASFSHLLAKLIG